MSTWIEDFVAEINGVDLLLPLSNNKVFDKDETTLGELDEYLQKLYRLRENRREIAESFRDKIEDVKSVHITEMSLGISSPKKSEAHMSKLKDLFDQFKAVFMPYITVDHLFSNELEKAFFLEMIQFPVTGIREGKFLVGRDNNSRSDQDSLDEFFIQIEILLDLEKTIKKSK